MRKWLRSVQFNITAAFVFLSVLVMLLVGVLLYDKFARTAERNAVLTTQQIVQQVTFNVEAYLRGTSVTFDLIDEKIRGASRFPDPALERELDTVLDTREDIVSIAVFGRRGGLIADIPSGELRKNTGLTSQSWFLAALSEPDRVSISPPHVQNLFKGQYPWVVSLSKGMTAVRNGVETEGVLLLDVNFKTIDTLMRKVTLGQKGYVYIIDGEGNIVYHPQQQLIYAGLKSENVERAMNVSNDSYKDDFAGEERLITVQSVAGTGWKVVGVSYMDEIVTTRTELTGFMLRLMLAVLVFVILLAYLLSSNLSRPIQSLERSMKLVERGDFDTPIHVRGYDEVEKLSRRFNIMVSRVRQLMDQIVEEQEEKRKNEFEVLQAQINPHFLYNTLNSVVRLAGSGKNEEVVTMITSLSKFFRVSLSKGKSVIPVRDELEHIRNYLIIQKLRFKNKFEFEITAQDEVLDLMTLKLLLQPIVENAIYHGIEKMVDQGYISISAAIVDGNVRFQVKDNGLGIPSDRLRTMLNGSKAGGEGSGVGVRNVHERIRLYYGDKYGLDVESELEEGTTVNIWIPVVKP
ncbi:cache domain-containing sensor histidine kinase [Paenibacillus alkalitolerans]|uniref:cache domain-containing sensor histidine kinase n=1 Tax=Paenibacillus alkalitolerans TaxID=2799335 RepID=UPI0018F66E44|nr:sensor histidine kinase [Paenibacillus alkalitolerans]